MRIEFDPKKDSGNLAKHGISLGLAYELDWNAALVWVDDRFEYDELRMIALAPGNKAIYEAGLARFKALPTNSPAKSNVRTMPFRRVRIPSWWTRRASSGT